MENRAQLSPISSEKGLSVGKRVSCCDVVQEHTVAINKNVILHLNCVTP